MIYIFFDTVRYTEHLKKMDKAYSISRNTGVVLFSEGEGWVLPLQPINRSNRTFRSECMVVLGSHRAAYSTATLSLDMIGYT